MLKDLLTPLSDLFDFETAKVYGNIAGIIQPYTTNFFPDVDQADIVIIGVGEERNAIDNEGVNLAPDAIRQVFYKLFPGEWHLNICDLGNLRKAETPEQTYANLQEVLSLLPVDISLIILGGSQDLTLGLTNYYDINNKVYNLSVIDAFIDSSLTDNEVDNENYLTDILGKQNSQLQNLSLFGIQSFFNHPSKFKILDQLIIDYFNLGDLKKDINEVEPELRDAHIVSVDVRSIKHADMPAQKQGMPNGFDGIEICQLARMSGIAPKNKVFGVFEYNPLLDQRLTGANLIAQMLWYYVDGKHKNQIEYPEIAKSELLKFYVENDILKLIFYKNQKTKRWWVEVAQFETNTRLIPCSEKDYQAALNGKMSKRILRIINKITI